MFIRILNKLFDLLTSRNLKAKGYKRPLQQANIVEMRAFLNDAKLYITSLKESRDGKSMFESNRKTGFLSFYICIDGMLMLYDILVESPVWFKICVYI